MYFGGIAFPRVELLRRFGKSWIWYDSGTTSESESCFCRATVEPNCNCSFASGHVGGQKQKRFSPLGNELYFDTNFAKKILLFWPPTWPPCREVANQELSSTRQEHDVWTGPYSRQVSISSLTKDRFDWVIACSGHMESLYSIWQLYDRSSGHRRTGNFLPGGAVNHLPKKFSQVAQIFTKQSKTNEGHTMR